VKPLSTLLVEYLSKSETQIKNYLEPLLGVFQKLLSQKSNDYHAFTIVLAILECFQINEIKKYLPQILKLVCVKLDKDRSARFISKFSEFYCSFVALVGFDLAFEATESVQKGMTAMLLENVVLANIKSLDGNKQRKNCALGMTEMVTAERFVRNFSEEQIIILLKETISIIELPPVFSMKNEEELENLERTGFSAQYSNLIFAAYKQHDPLSKLGEAKKLLALKLSSLSKKVPNKVFLCAKWLKVGEFDR
ncbi:Exportin-2, variant 2, partial [Bonamia ostreae]